MKPNKINPQYNPHYDQPSHVKLQHVIQDRLTQNQCSQVQSDIFTYLQVSFKINQIRINEQEHLHTVFVRSHNVQKKSVCFYLAHGFGGSSLMYFPIVKYLLDYGNVVLWEVRGMGLSKKLANYSVLLQESEDFFVKPIDLMLKFYRHKQISFISHSFGGYLTLLYVMKYKTFLKNIKEVILLSPVGITPKQQDYKFKINNFSDALHTFGNFISWKFHLTYKSPFRCICSCLKNKVFKGAVQDCGFNEQEKVLMKDLLVTMVDSSDGSQNVFFNYFQPRVLPKFPIEPIFKQCPSVCIKIIYGGQQDWVDKKGAQNIRQRFPDKIDIKLVKQCGHNFPFFPVQLKRVLEQILFHEKSNKKQSILMQIDSSEAYQKQQGQKSKKNPSNQISTQLKRVNFQRFDDQNSDDSMNYHEK